MHSCGLPVILVEHPQTATERFDERAIGLDHLAFRVPDRETLEAWAGISMRSGSNTPASRKRTAGRSSCFATLTTSNWRSGRSTPPGEDEPGVIAGFRGYTGHPRNAGAPQRARIRQILRCLTDTLRPVNLRGVVDPDSDRAQLRAIFLTDVEGSTREWREPKRMPASLDVLDASVERAVAEDGGEIVRSCGRATVTSSCSSAWEPFTPQRDCSRC